MKNLTILTTIFLVSSCAFHNGTLTSNVTENPVVHTDIASGVASTNIVLGIGGLSKDALISSARKNMIHTRPLEGAEQYNNIEVNIKNTYYLFGRKTKVTINADVIEPKDSINQATYSENYLDKIRKEETGTGIFAMHDSVICDNYNYQEGEIIRFTPDQGFKEVSISYTDKNDELQIKSISINKIFIRKTEHRGLKLGQRLPEGVIIGFGNKRILITSTFGKTTVRYP